MTLSQALDWLKHQLPPPENKREAELFVQDTLAVNRAYLRTHPERRLTEAQQQQLSERISRRLAGEPLAYILGYTEFYGLRLQVSPAVLIPRADTELLVDLALKYIDPSQRTQVLDLGTGSGAIAIAIATERPLAQVTATDASFDALAVAQDNVCAHRLNVKLQHSDWFSALPQQTFDIIVSNPPYIVENDPHLQQTSLPFEPISALISGTDGLDDITHIIRQAPHWLAPQGWLLLEHGYDQGQAVRSQFEHYGFQSIQTHQDYGQQDRVTMGQLGR